MIEARRGQAERSSVGRSVESAEGRRVWMDRCTEGY